MPAKKSLKRVLSVDNLQDDQLSAEFSTFISKRVKRQRQQKPKSASQPKQPDINQPSSQVQQSQPDMSSGSSKNADFGQSSSSSSMLSQSKMFSDTVAAVVSHLTAQGSAVAPPVVQSIKDDPVVVQLLHQVADLQSKVQTLTAQLQFVMSFLEITESSSPPPAGELVDQTVTYAAASKPRAPHVVVPPPPPPPSALDAQLRHDLVSAVYVDMQSTQRRARNIVITGFPTSAHGSEAEHVNDFLDVEFRRRFDIVVCRRVGKPYPGKLQPLLVTLGNERQAAYLVDNAKQLRASSTLYVSQSIYINADMTRAQAKAAYDIRCRRRNNRRSSASGRVFTRTRPDQDIAQSFEDPMTDQSSTDVVPGDSPPGLQLSGPSPSSASSAPALKTASSSGASYDTTASIPAATQGSAQLAGSCA